MNPERSHIDPAEIKAAADLVAVARRYTALRKISHSGEHAGPCPLCGGMDRFHVKDQRFYCRQCYPRGGDAIDLVMRMEEMSFQEACARLASLPSFSERPPPTTSPLVVVSQSESLSRLDEHFQQSARKTMMATHCLLLSRQGVEGQAYLAARGLHEATWRTYQVGFGHTFHPVHRQNQAAIFLPWYSADGSSIYAIQHRFIDPSLAKGERYGMKRGSQPLLFGLQALAPAEQVIITEGEFNCMALHQVGHQTISVGSETNRTNEQVIRLLHNQLAVYEQVVVWFDKPAYGQQFADRLTHEMPFRKEIRVVDVAGPDANELLMTGELMELMRQLG